MAFLDIFKKERDPKSPTKAGGASEGSISSDIIPFLNIIAKNSLALPGMARDMNVLRQNIVKLVKLKNAEAITKADKFFKTEDQKEAELEAARKKEMSPTQEGKPKKEKVDKDSDAEGILGVLWDFIKKILASIFIGLGLAFAAVFNVGKMVADLVEKLNPMELIDNLFQSIKDGWKAITETDIVKETLIKGVGKFLDFITGGLFGEKELRQSLSDLQEYIAPMIDVISETFENIVAWLKDNIGWDPFTIPLSKVNDFLPDWAKKFSLPDIQIPGFRPFDKKSATPAAKSGGAPSATIPEPKEDLKKAKTSGGDVVYDEMGNIVSGSTSEEKKPSKQTTKKTQEGKVERTPKNIAKDAEKDNKSAIEFLKTQVGVVYDENSPTKFSDYLTGNFVEEEAVRNRIQDMKGNPDKILSLVKGKVTEAASPSVAPKPQTSQVSDTATASGGAALSGGGSMPTPDMAPSPSTSGGVLSQTSAEVAEGQRMDSAADAGVYVDAGTVNSSSSSVGKKPKQTADAYNSSFINSYYSAA